MHSEMKERQRWTTEEDAILLAYVKQYGPREWHLVSHRMNTPLDRDAKSCLERWKNYLKPGIKKGSLTEDEQRLVIRLQAKHGNKWKKIAAEVPGRTAKRLGKWWEVYKEKQLRAKKESCKSFEPIEEGKYDRILETFAEKLVKERAAPTTLLMASSNGGFLHGDQTVIPPWLSSSSPRPLSPSVTLSLASSTIAPPPPVTSPMVASWLPPPENAALTLGSHPCGGEQMLMSEVMECYREVEEAHRALASHKKEAAWRLKRVELQLESEKAARRREKVEDIEAKIKALREEQWASLERLDAEYREQLTGLRSDAEAKEQKMVEQWATKHLQLMKLVEEIMSCRARLAKPNGH